MIYIVDIYSKWIESGMPIVRQLFWTSPSVSDSSQRFCHVIFRCCKVSRRNSEEGTISRTIRLHWINQTTFYWSDHLRFGQSDDVLLSRPPSFWSNFVRFAQTTLFRADHLCCSDHSSCSDHPSCFRPSILLRPPDFAQTTWFCSELVYFLKYTFFVSREKSLLA